MAKIIKHWIWSCVRTIQTTSDTQANIFISDTKPPRWTYTLYGDAPYAGNKILCYSTTFWDSSDGAEKAAVKMAKRIEKKKTESDDA